MVSSDVLVVLMGDRPAGTLTRLRGGKVRFEYDDAYCDRPEATPLSVSMPTEIRIHDDHAITPWLWGLLPDNEAVLARWSRQFQVSLASPFGLLSTPLGEDCPGEIRVTRRERLGNILGSEGRANGVDWLTEADVAQRIRDLRADSTAWLGFEGAGRFSLAGAQGKTALLRRDGHWGNPRGGNQTTHILKPAIAGLDDHDLNEHLCLAAMRLAGLSSVRTSVERFEDQSAIVVTRYDRHPGGRRIHQEDLCQALGVHPARKYQNEGGPGPRDVAAALRRTMPGPVAANAQRTFADAIIWNWAIAGTDAHAKNYSLLLSGTQVRLAPFYDVASALPYGIAEQKLRLAMKLGSGYRVNPGSKPWRTLGLDIGLTEDELRSRASSLLGAIPDAYAEVAGTAEVRELGSDLAARLTDGVAERVARCVRLLS